MSTEKMREEFEAWASSRCMQTKTDGESYYHHRTSGAWDAWKGDRESIAHKLIEARKYVAFAFGEGLEGAEQAGIDLDAAIDSLGLKVKP
ncbi:hypothetical protein [Pseudomonas sp. MF6787]|uniref:hypothetical protein n=1 Tax=Pseudomonas sp. MF6787 TaxID=2797536 RepID=UPI0018E7F86E|nr:hypothetical protein [Pseudomonas sp. MF6787]MBJ2265219.1 hypothetical protein [Pseudomonas sp. MF6787]